jgi:hypothetical protein
MSIRPRRLLLWLAISVTAFVFEFSLIAAAATRLGRVDARRELPQINWGVGDGRYYLIVPHEAAGRNPHVWPGQRPSLLGFELHIASRGRSPEYMRVTLLSVPCWFVALLAGLMTFWLARALGMKLGWRRRQRHGFDVIERPQAGQTEESESSAPST